MTRAAVFGFAFLAVLPAARLDAQPLLLSANDGLQTFADGVYRMREHAGLGTLSAYDLSTLPPRPLWRVPLEQTAVGPPLAIAPTPDGRLAIVGNPAIVDPADSGKIKQTQDLQVVHLEGASGPAAVERVALGHHPWCVAIAPDGRLAATANGDGTVTLLRIAGSTVTPIGDTAVGTPQSLDTGVAFSRDGRFLLVSRRRDDLVSLFRVKGESLEPVRDLTVGSNPYEIAVSPDGRFAAVSNVGRTSGDHDSVSLVDLSAEPVRTTGVIAVGPTPEGLAISPDSRWLAVNSIDGSNLKPDNPFHAVHSLIQLFDLGAATPRLAGTAEVGANAQGLAFTPDGTALIVQDYTADALLTFTAGSAGLKPAGTPIATQGGPSALAVAEVKSPP